MPAASTRLNELLDAAGVPIDGVSQRADGTFRVDFKPEATEEQKAQAATIAGQFNGLSTPDFNAEAFLDAVADATSNTGVYLIALRLARFGTDSKRKAKYADHAALPAPQKLILENAAIAAGGSLK